MKLFLALSAAAFSLSGCDVVNTVALDTGRDAAKAVVGPIVADTVQDRGARFDRLHHRQRER